jgi:transposase-like protein
LDDEVVEAWRDDQRQKQVRLSPQAVDDLLAAYRAGTPCHELALRFGINESTVFAHLKRWRVERRPFRKLRGDQLQRAKELYESGQSLRSVASALALSKEAVRSGLVCHGVVIRTRRGLR